MNAKKQLNVRISAKLKEELKVIVPSTGKKLEEFVEETLAEKVRELKNSPDFLDVVYKK